MQLEKGDIFEVVDDRNFHIPTDVDLMGHRFEVIDLYSTTIEALVGHLETTERYTLENFEMLEQDFKGHYTIIEHSEQVSPKAGQISSDGGSSSYYDMPIPEWVMKNILDRSHEGQAYIKVEELIESTFDSDFDFGNAFKSLVRAKGAYEGKGKAGNTVDYECNKIKYSVDKIKAREGRKTP